MNHKKYDDIRMVSFQSHHHNEFSSCSERRRMRNTELTTSSVRWRNSSMLEMGKGKSGKRQPGIFYMYYNQLGAVSLICRVVDGSNPPR